MVECTEAVWVTCSDEGRLVEVLQPPRRAFGTAPVRTPEGEEEVDVTLVGEVAAGGCPFSFGFAGYDGGRLAVGDDVEYCFTVDSRSLHPIQESQALVGHRLWLVAQPTLTDLRSETPTP